jgi:hypothetical protein
MANCIRFNSSFFECAVKGQLNINSLQILLSLACARQSGLYQTKKESWQPPGAQMRLVRRCG